MSKETHKILTSSKNPNWRTPKELYKTLHTEFNFALDAAASQEDHLCDWWYGPGSPYIPNALIAENWQGNCHYEPTVSIFCNPPYSKGNPIDPWMIKLAKEGCIGPSPVVGIIPYSPQTKWWRKYVMGQSLTLGQRCDPNKFPVTRATEVRLFPYRLKFEAPEGHEGSTSGANVNTAIVIWKPTKGFVEPWSPAFRYWSYR